MSAKIYPVDCLPDRILLGRQTENGVRTITIDCSAWRAEWPGMVASLWVTPPGGGEGYPANAVPDGDHLVWTVSDADTAVAGDGMVEVVGMVDGLKKLSAMTQTYVLVSTTARSGAAPEAYQGWLESVLAAGAAALESAELAAASEQEAAESAAAAKADAEAVAGTVGGLEQDAEEHAKNAAHHAGEAKMYATLAEQSAATHGFFYTYIDDTGHLHYVRSDGLLDLNLRIDEGRLVASYGMA